MMMRESTRSIQRCPLCGAPAPDPFLVLPVLPVLCNVLWDTEDDARTSPRAPIELAVCPECTLIYNLRFDPSRIDYTVQYDNCLHYSKRFVAYAENLANRLRARYALDGALVVEVGCGKGDFLRLLCRGGHTRGLGFDPSYEGPAGGPDDAVQIVPRYYDENQAIHGGDLLVCRQVLEHILEPAPFLDRIARGLGRADVPVFFEVPNGLYTVRNAFVWDVIYEHPLYYGPVSIARAFARAGYRVEEIREEFEGQYLGVHAVTGWSGESVETGPDFAGQGPDVADFRSRYTDTLVRWNGELSRIARESETAVVWGAGSKGITFLNLVEESSAIQCAVDVSPAKQHRFVSGTGHEIVAPEELRRVKPDVVFLMNPVYKEEVGDSLRRLDLHARLICL